MSEKTVEFGAGELTSIREALEERVAAFDIMRRAKPKDSFFFHEWECAKSALEKFNRFYHNTTLTMRGTSRD